jgi:lysophospholipase L1-like esterase
MAFSGRLALLLIGIFGSACSDTGQEDAATGGVGGTGAPGGRGGSNASPGGTAGTAPGGAGTASSGTSGRGGNASAGMPGGAGTGTASAGRSGAGGNADGAGGNATAGNGAEAGAASGGTGGADASAGEGGAAASGEPGSAGSAGNSDPGGLPGFVLAVLGSSTAAGEGASSSARGWVGLLGSSLEQSVTGDFTAHNLAVGGYTTTNLLPDSGSSGSIDAALEREPNLIVVALAGSNDLSNGVSTNTFLTRLTTIRDAAVDAGVPIFFLSTAPKDLSNEEQQTLADWGEAIGEDFGGCWTPNDPNYSPCFIDIFSALADVSLGIAEEYGAGDGIHLNDAGHARIFEVAEPIVRDYVCSMTACR